uniref:Uncharacterized protein n=1 Tax=Spironucleus salmonicida TaxID=348837 RepID=V6LIA5_9EUKA|eukprot:EST44048.1 Hypothetical protein SS50377_16362 [Spironucleus salmonicida]
MQDPISKLIGNRGIVLYLTKQEFAIVLMPKPFQQCCSEIERLALNASFHIHQTHQKLNQIMLALGMISIYNFNLLFLTF